MINQLLSPTIQSFIDDHQHADPNGLLLKNKFILGLPASLVVEQIISRKKAKEKIPAWSAKKNLVFPHPLSLEQSSSEKTAKHKAKILTEIFDIPLSDVTLLDLTGGIGVDSFFFSEVCKEIHFVEPNEELLNIVMHNFKELGVTNVFFHNSTAESFLQALSADAAFDLVYIDPSRRTEGGQKVFSLNQSEPDVVKLQARILQVTNNLLIKTSPLLDIRQGITEIHSVRKVYVVSVDNECKELLFHSKSNSSSEVVVDAINLSRKESSFSFSLSEEQNANVKISNPLTYVYEPNASLLKSGAFKILSSTFNLFKLHPNTHLYTSDVLIADFPGRIFKIESFVKPDDRKMLEKLFEDGKANIFTRNYPLSVAQLRKKTRLKEGGEKFLIGCTGIEKKLLIVASRLDGK